MKKHIETQRDRFFKPVFILFDRIGNPFARSTRQSGAPAAAPSRGGPAERELSRRAFALWERAGHPADREWDFWDQAEREFTAESRPPCHRTNFQTLRQNRPQFWSDV